MIATTVSGVNCWLLPYEPNIGAAIKVEISLPMDEHRGLTGRSTRRQTALLPRYELSWSSLLELTDFVALRDASLASLDEPILVPLWPHLFAPGEESPTMTGGLMIAFKWDWSAWAINPGSYDGYDAIAPLLYGRFKQPPRLASQCGNLIQAQFDFTEDGPAAYAVLPATGILAADTTSSIGGNSFPNFPFLPDWETVPQPGVGVYDVERNEAGPGRMKATVFYPQVPERVPTASFTGLSKTEAAQIIAWWIRRGGQAGAHLVSLESFGIQSGGTILARHTNQTLALSYAGIVAQVDISWREVAPEAAVPAGETLGSTLGALPPAAWFFQIDLDYHGAIQTTYLTDWESGAVANGQTWVYNPCDFDKLIQSIDLEDDNCTFRLRWWAGCPWENWMPGELCARGFLTISRCDISALGDMVNFRQIWRGELSTPTLEGPDLSVTVLGANALFSRRAPRQVMSTTCGTNLFSARCAIALTDWMVSGPITDIAGQVVTVGPVDRVGGLPNNYWGANNYALGYAQWTDEGGSPRRSEILASVSLTQEYPANRMITLTLARPLGAAIGDTISLVPGCDRQGATCINVFRNHDHFRGFEFMPAISPSFIIPQKNVTSAKK